MVTGAGVNSGVAPVLARAALLSHIQQGALPGYRGAAAAL